MKIREVHDYFKNLAYWNNWSQTCDGFLWGDPDHDLEGIAVCWSSMKHQLGTAIDKGCNLYISHEPLYSYVRHNQYAHPAEEEKASLLRQSRIVVYRCHDVLDMMPGIGIPEAWAKFIGFDGPPAATRNYYRAYDLPDGTTAGQVASRILAKVREIGQEIVHVLGPQDKAVSRLVVGTGAITDFRVMAQMGDILLLTDDGTRLWESAQWSGDTGTPLLIVNHATAEEPGVKALAGHLSKNLEVPVHFIPQGCLYRSRWE